MEVVGEGDGAEGETRALLEAVEDKTLAVAALELKMEVEEDRTVRDEEVQGPRGGVGVVRDPPEEGRAKVEEVGAVRRAR